MARTFKDHPEFSAPGRRKKTETLSTKYIRERNPRLAKHDPEADQEICPKCCEPLEYIHGIPYCDVCGWSTIEDVVDEMDRYEAA